MSAPNIKISINFTSFISSWQIQTQYISIHNTFPFCFLVDKAPLCFSPWGWNMTFIRKINPAIRRRFGTRGGHKQKLLQTRVAQIASFSFSRSYLEKDRISSSLLFYQLSNSFPWSRPFCRQTQSGRLEGEFQGRSGMILKGHLILLWLTRSLVFYTLAGQ